MSKITQGLKKKRPSTRDDGEVRAWLAAVATIDRIAGDLERVWGVDRLQTLVPADLAAKFTLAQEQLDVAIASGDLNAAAQKGAALGRGWMALDAAARAAGHRPGDVGAVWCYDLDGLSYAVCLRSVDCAGAAQQYPSHKAVSVEELLRLMRASESGRWTLAIKDEFPGATFAGVVPKSDKGTNLNDELPF